MTPDSVALLAELGQLEQFLGQLSDKLDATAEASQAGTAHIQIKMDEWIQTNRTMAELARDLLRGVVNNSEAVTALTQSYESSASFSQDLRPQLQSFEHSMQDLHSALAQQSHLGREVAQAFEQIGVLLTELQQATGQLPRQVPTVPTRQRQMPHTGSQAARMATTPATTKEKFPGVSLSVELVRRATAPLAILGSLLLAVGSGVGFTYAQVHQPPPRYWTQTAQPLTLEEAALLAWARSKDGQFAKNLMAWNSGILDGGLTCTEEVERLGVTLKLQGRPASYGFCTVWVVPPNQRQFVGPE